MFLKNITKIIAVLRRKNHPEVDKKAMAIMLLHVFATVMKTKLPHLNSLIAEVSVDMTAENPAKWTSDALVYLSYHQVTSTEGFIVDLYDLVRLASEHGGEFSGIPSQLSVLASGFLKILLHVHLPI